MASREHARFKQTDADVGSFDGGFGSAYLAGRPGEVRRARSSSWAGPYDADTMYQMGAVNEVVDHVDLEKVGLQWAAEINGKSQAIRMLKFSFNLIDDGLVGQQVFAGEGNTFGVYDRRRRGGPRRLPARSAIRTGAVSRATSE